MRFLIIGALALLSACTPALAEKPSTAAPPTEPTITLSLPLAQRVFSVVNEHMQGALSQLQADQAVLKAIQDQANKPKE